MLHFLENHDEERIASPNFASDPELGKPAMAVSALIGRSPTMIYFGQEVGEDARGNTAFNEPMRNSLFDYQGLPALQRWASDDSTPVEASLRDFYRRLLNLSTAEIFAQGEYEPIDADNVHLFAFARWLDDEQLVVVSNFDAVNAHAQMLEIPANIIADWRLADGRYALSEKLYGTNNGNLVVDGGKAHVAVKLDPLESVVFKVGTANIDPHEQ